MIKMSHLNNDKEDYISKDKNSKKNFLIFDEESSNLEENQDDDFEGVSNLKSDDFDDDFFLEDSNLNSDNLDLNIDAEFVEDEDDLDLNIDAEFMEDESDDLNSNLDDLNFLDEENNLEGNDVFHEINNLDLRIITDNPKNGEILSTAIGNIDLGEDFHIIISAIIPTTDLNIAINTTKGADIILMASENESDFSNFYESLKTEHNYVEFLKLSTYKDIKSIENQITNLIIKVGLSSIFKITGVNHVQNQFNQLNEEYLNVLAENDSLKTINKKLSHDNNGLASEIDSLQSDLDGIKSDFSDFKSRYSNIHMKNILEIFSLSDLWMELFSEELSYDEKIVIATNNFKPENIIVGQGYIGANSKEEAVDWLKVVKTAIIFVEHNEDNLKKEFSSVEKPKTSSHSPESRYNNYSDDGEEDYEIPNNFSNFFP